jgi:hypothetical protein
MDMHFKQLFLDQWNKYFPGAELPIVFYYTDEDGHGELAGASKDHRCLICDLAAVRHGKPMCFSNDTVPCGGGKRYLGFVQRLRPDFEYFLSCGIPDALEGERYKKTPELVNELIKNTATFKAPAQHIVFKRWDAIQEADEPLVVIFFATADVLSGLFTLANFDLASPYGVITPFCAGCGSIVQHPLAQLESEQPKAVLGMFDVSARPCVPPDRLTFAVPWPRFETMVRNMDESFLITESWRKVKERIGKKI